MSGVVPLLPLFCLHGMDMDSFTFLYDTVGSNSKISIFLQFVMIEIKMSTGK